MATEISKEWKNGRRLTVSFLGGKKQVKDRIIRHAKIWMDHANIEFDFTARKKPGNIRIAFDTDDVTVPPWPSWRSTTGPRGGSYSKRPADHLPVPNCAVTGPSANADTGKPPGPALSPLLLRNARCPALPFAMGA